MKKITFLVAVLFAGLFTQAQEVGTIQTNEFPRHEINYNILNSLIVASAEVGYEYFFHFNQSLGAKVLINDRPSYGRTKGRRNLKTKSWRINNTYYIGEEQLISELSK